MSNKPTVRKITLASESFINALVPVCGHLEKGEVRELANKVSAIHHHAKSDHSKRDFFECSVCQRNVQHIHMLPPQTAAVVLENEMKSGFSQKLGTVIMENARRRFMDNSKRAEQDYNHTAALFAHHKKQHPKQYRKH